MLRMLWSLFPSLCNYDFIYFVTFLFLKLQFMMHAPIDHVVVCWHVNKVAVMMKLHFVDVISLVSQTVCVNFWTLPIFFLYLYFLSTCMYFKSQFCNRSNDCCCCCCSLCLCFVFTVIYVQSTPNEWLLCPEICS